MPDTHKKRLVFGKRMDAVGENLFAVDKSDHAGGPLKRAAVGKTYPAVEESYPAVGTFFHGILFFPARAPL